MKNKENREIKSHQNDPVTATVFSHIQLYCCRYKFIFDRLEADVSEQYISLSIHPLSSTIEYLWGCCHPTDRQYLTTYYLVCGRKLDCEGRYTGDCMYSFMCRYSGCTAVYLFFGQSGFALWWMLRNYSYGFVYTEPLNDSFTIQRLKTKCVVCG